jgi:hypothetical protein
MTIENTVPKYHNNNFVSVLGGLLVSGLAGAIMLFWHRNLEETRMRSAKVDAGNTQN